VLLAELTRLLPGASIARVPPAAAPLAEHLAAAAEPYWRARLLVALLSLLAVPAAYAIARAFLPRGPSLVAAGFAATSLLLANYGQQARPHAASAALCAASVAACLVHLRRGGHATFALASAACAASLAALHQGVFALPALALAWWWAPRRRAAQLLWATAFLALSVRWGYALHFTPGAVGARDGELDVGGQMLGPERFTAAGFEKIARGLWTYDPALLVCALLGLAALCVALRRARVERRTLAVAAVFPAGFLLFWGLMEHMFPRFTAPVVPFLAVLAAAGLAALAHAITAALARARAPRSDLVLLALSVLALALPAYAAARLAALRAGADTQQSLADWLGRHVDPAREVVAHSLFVRLPLERARASVEALPAWARGPWDRHALALEGAPPRPLWRCAPIFRPGVYADRRLDESEAESILRDARATLAVVSTATDRGAEYDDTLPALRRIAGEPVHALAPYDPRRTSLGGSGYELGYAALARVLGSAQWGPPLAVYRLEAPAQAPR
jgi:hypothetical protein